MMYESLWRRTYLWAYLQKKQTRSDIQIRKTNIFQHWLMKYLFREWKTIFQAADVWGNSSFVILSLRCDGDSAVDGWEGRGWTTRVPQGGSRAALEAVVAGRDPHPPPSSFAVGVNRKWRWCGWWTRSRRGQAALPAPVISHWCSEGGGVVRGHSSISWPPASVPRPQSTEA